MIFFNLNTSNIYNLKTLEPPLKNEIIKVIPLSFGTLLCSKNYCISEVIEGYHIDEKEIIEFIDSIKDFYKNRKIHYINNRIAFFSVNPLCYNHFKRLEENILSTRAVLYISSQEHTAKFEREFYPLGVTFYKNLYDAVNDLNRIVIDH